jgi:hypothetical protein
MLRPILPHHSDHPPLSQARIVRTHLLCGVDACVRAAARGSEKFVDVAACLVAARHPRPGRGVTEIRMFSASRSPSPGEHSRTCACARRQIRSDFHDRTSGAVVCLPAATSSAGHPGLTWICQRGEQHRRSWPSPQSRDRGLNLLLEAPQHCDKPHQTGARHPPEW